MPWFYYIGKYLVIMIVLLFTRCRINGLENVPRTGAVLIVSNHLSMADPPLIGAKLGRYIYFMAKEELFQFKPVGAFLRNVGAFSIKRGGLDRSALSKTRRVLKNGKALVIFPEG